MRGKQFLENLDRSYNKEWLLRKSKTFDIKLKKIKRVMLKHKGNSACGDKGIYVLREITEMQKELIHPSNLH